MTAAPFSKEQCQFLEQAITSVVATATSTHSQAPAPATTIPPLLINPQFTTSKQIGQLYTRQKCRCQTMAIPSGAIPPLHQPPARTLHGVRGSTFLRLSHFVVACPITQQSITTLHLRRFQGNHAANILTH